MLTLIIVLSITGTLALILEVFLPGGILGVAGGLCIAAAAIITLATPSLAIATRLGITIAIIAFAVGAFALTMTYFQRTKIGKLFTLDTAATGSAPPPTENIAVGTNGTAATDLSPLGTIQVADTTADALSESGFIPTGTAVRVSKIESGSIYVVQA